MGDSRWKYLFIQHKKKKKKNDAMAVHYTPLQKYYFFWGQNNHLKNTYLIFCCSKFLKLLYPLFPWWLGIVFSMLVIIKSNSFFFLKKKKTISPRIPLEDLSSRVQISQTLENSIPIIIILHITNLQTKDWWLTFHVSLEANLKMNHM